MKLKIRTLSILWITIISTMIFATDKLVVRVMLTIIAIGVTIHILLKKTKKSDSKYGRYWTRERGQNHFDPLMLFNNYKPIFAIKSPNLKQHL